MRDHDFELVWQPSAEVTLVGDLVITEKLASRLDARIERRHDTFVLVDSSVKGIRSAGDG